MLLKNKAIFFRDKTDATKFEPNKELVKICSDKSFEKFCEIIGETRLLITAINNYLIKNGLKNEKQNKYDELIKNLANAIQNFYDFRQCHPYVFFSLVDEQQRLPTPYQAKRFLELIVSGLRQRLLYEQKYSEVLKAPPSASVHQEKIFILSNFLQDTGRLFLPLESTEKALEIIQNVLTLSIEKSEGYFSQSPSLVLFRPTGEQGRQSRLKKSSNSKTNCFERSSELVNP
jgi:tetratricopeptide (TPR) repeat protein